MALGVKAVKSAGAGPETGTKGEISVKLKC
jgi:hypothetical protein